MVCDSTSLVSEPAELHHEMDWIIFFVKQTDLEGNYAEKNVDENLVSLKLI